MTVSFNRARQRVLDAENAVEVYAVNTQYPNKPVNWEEKSRVTSTLFQKESIRDVVPTGKFKPGEFKITAVERCKLFQQTDDFEVLGILYNSLYPAWRIKGKYNNPLSFTPQTDIPISPFFVNKDVNELCMNALAKVSSADIGGGETLAEAEKTLKMLRNPMMGVKNILNRSLSKKTRKGRRGRKTLDDASNSWLEARYGWTPLVYTIRDLVKNMPRVLDSSSVLSEYAKRTKVVSSTTTTSGGFYRAPFTMHARGFRTDTKVQRGTVYYRVTDGNGFRRLKLGLDLVSVPKLMYELTRLSFALDWWFNLGDWISANVPNPYIHILGYTFSEKSTILNTSVLEKVTCRNMAGPDIQASAIYREKLETYRREPVYPNISALPTIDTEFHSIKHVVDSLGLITQMVPKRRH